MLTMECKRKIFHSYFFIEPKPVKKVESYLNKASYLKVLKC